MLRLGLTANREMQVLEKLPKGDVVSFVEVHVVEVLCACRFCTALRLGRTAVPCSLTPFSPLATSRRHLRHPQTDADQPVSFMQTFLLRTDATGNWFVAHDIFRLVLHNG